MRKTKVYSIVLSLLLFVTVLVTGCDDGLPSAPEGGVADTSQSTSLGSSTIATSGGDVVTTTTSAVGNSVHDMAAEQGGNLLITDKQDNIAKCEFIPLAKGADGKSQTWSDFVFIQDKLWVFFASGDENHTKKNGLLRIYDPETGALEQSFFHNFGKMGTVDYDVETDRLLVGNIPGNDTYPAAIYIFDHVSSWNDEKDGSTLLFADRVSAIVDVSAMIQKKTTQARDVVACWGEDESTAYVSVGYNQFWWKITLGVGTNDLGNGVYSDAAADAFNGTYQVVWMKGFTPVHSKYQEQTYGMIFEDGCIHTTNGRHEIQWWEWTATQKGMTRSEHRVAVINADGSLRYSISKGIAIYNGYLYVGCMFSDKGEDTYAENHEVCTGDHGLIRVKIKK